MEKTIYPLIRTEEMADHYLLETYVRKQGDDNKYYLWKWQKKIIFGDVTEKEKTNMIIAGIEQFNIEAYRFSVRGQVHIETGFFELDENQQSEFDRLETI
jgi:hypothetical protein